MTDGGVRPELTPRQLRQRRDRRRSSTIAAASTVVVFAAIALVVVRAPGYDEVRAAFFDGERFRESLPDVLDAFWLNVRVFLTAEAFILVIALLLAMAKGSRAPALFPVRLLATIYIDVLRGIPIILVLFLLGFGVPALRLDGVPNDPVFWATVALVLSYSAYVAEVYRAGIDSVHETQRAAARAVGLSSFQSMRFVVLPQAVRRVVPPLLNDFIALQKETALVGVLGPIDAARAAQIDSSRTFNFTAYLAAAVIFLAMTIPLTRFTDRMLRRRQQRVAVAAGPA